MNAILVLLQKDIALFFKDKTAIALTFLVPFVIILIVGNIFGKQTDSGGLQGAVRLAVLDESGSDAAAELITALEKEEGIEVVKNVEAAEGEAITFDRDSIRVGIEKRNYNFALVIPENFIKEDGIGVRLRYLSNPRNEVEAQIVYALIQKAVFTSLPPLLAGQLDATQAEAIGAEKYDQFQDGLAALISLYFDELEYEEIRPRMGVSGLVELINDPNIGFNRNAGDNAEETEASDDGGMASFFEDILEIEEDQVFGEEVKNPYLTRMIGGYAIMFLLFATTGSATSLFEERNEGIFQRVLSMPVRRTQILWSKYLFNLLLGIVQVMTLFVASSLLFDVGVFDHFFNLLLVSIFAASACTAFGMFLASISKTQQQAQGFGTLLIISMSAIGGAWFPLAWMPEIMQIFGKLTLVYWGVEGFLAVLWEGASLLAILPILGVIAAYTATLIAISLWRFRSGDLFR